MIVGCYTLDLYCENEEIKKGYVFDNYGHKYNEFPHQYVGHNISSCLKDARKDGWKINTKLHKAYCPKCNKIRQPDTPTKPK